MSSNNTVLKQGLQMYQNPDRTKQDIQTALTQFNGLSIKFNKYVFNDGSEKTLLALDGVIPVRYKGVKYNIPVVIWLLDTHPYNSPICYVKPTAYMEIKPSKHVDQSGKIYLPYLHDWKPNGSDLLSLIQVMTVVFGEIPPVYSKSSPSVIQPVSGYPHARPPGGYPPYPVNPSMPVPSYQIGPQFQPPASNMPYPQPPPYSPAAKPDNTTGTITQEHLRASMESAVKDKMKGKFRELVAQIHAEMEVLRRTQQDLTEGRKKLDALLQRLEGEQVELERTTTSLKEKDEELTETLQKLQDEEDVDVDEAVMPTTPLYKQLLSAYAEESSTQDAIYFLTDGLRAGVIDLDTYLKHVRSLSRQQFLLRATMIRCRQKAKLAC